jgi:SAM-dependent methyltransferase
MPDFARFDRRHYPTVPVREGYRDWTPSYENTVEDAMDYALLERVTCVPWGGLKRVADIGCGTGRTGAWLASKGASGLVGVDLTPEMLERAKARELYDELSVADVRETGLPAGAFELVTCNLVDEHLAELGPLYTEVRRLLAPGGFFVLVGFHPFFIMTSGMPTHFEHPERGSVAVETNIHLLSDHVSAGRAVGLELVEMHERLVDDEWIALKPSWEKRRDWPISFALVWQASE